ncbi:MAG: hypothetical protein V3T83_18375 [Acidobacteriota bacterium]
MGRALGSPPSSWTAAAERTNHHLDPFAALVIVILRALLGTLPKPDRPEHDTWVLAKLWVGKQARITEESLRETSGLVFLLEALAKSMVRLGEESGRRYGFGFTPGEDGRISFEAGLHDLLLALKTVAHQEFGDRMPFATVLELRLKLLEEYELLKAEGWQFEKVRPRVYRFQREAV